MGVNVSKSTVESMINDSISILNTYAQNCTVNSGDANNIIDLEGCTVSESGKIVIKSNQAVNVNCITNSTTQSSIESSISQQMRASAEAISQQFSFPNLSYAESFISDSVELGRTISRAYNQTCKITNGNTNSTIKCDKSTKVDGLVEIDSAQSSAINCVLDTKDVTTIKNRLISRLESSSVARQSATFVYIIYGFLLFLAILAWFFISIANNPLVEWLIVFVVFFIVVSSIVYAIMSKPNGYYPYKRQ